MRHDFMADDEKIDPALVKLAHDNPRQIFIQKGDPGYGIQWTSTCTDTPARWPIHTETQWTPMLFDGIAARYEWLQANRPGYDYKQRLYYAGEPFGRREGTVKKAIPLFPKST
jgi:hypothetical protein